MEEIKQILQSYLYKPVSITLRHGFRVDGIIELVGEDVVLLNALDHENNQQYEFIVINLIVSIRVSGKDVESIKNFMLKELSEFDKSI